MKCSHGVELIAVNFGVAQAEGCSIMSLKSTIDRCLAFAASKDARATKKTVISVLIILGIWLSVVIFVETRHEFWRDEVRAFSLAREASSPLDLYNLIKYEGHPVLWYLLLFLGKSIVNTPLILPVTAVVIGLAAIAVFMFYAPFPLWFKCLFIFSALPLYEYSVMARNYGISMLLMFIAAALYRKRRFHPYWFALTLALLANTNVHSTILASLLAAVWVWDVLHQQKGASFKNYCTSLILPLMIVLGGIALCVIFVLPGENTILAPGTTSFSANKLVLSAFTALVRPDKTFNLIEPAGSPSWVCIGLIILAVLGLIRRPSFFLAALVGQIALGVFFLIVYYGSYRHQGLFLIFLLVLYWLFNDEADHRSPNRIINLLNKAGLYIAIGFLVIGNLALSIPTIQVELTQEKSSSKAFGTFLNQSAAYHNAIIIPEPDYYIESLAYYADNQIYFPRERRFGTTVSWTDSADARLSLSDLLASARNLNALDHRPVLIVLGHFDIDPRKDGVKQYSYNKFFSWTQSDFIDFYQSTVLIGKYNSAFSDENYLVYALKEP